jgi:ferritin-like metal-binding protein YciE
MKENSLRHLYVEELKDLYNAENQLVKALPKMAKAATSEKLRAGFEEHLEQTKGHVSRLEEIFEAMEESPKGKKCKGMEGLITEGSEMIGEDPGDEELDAGLISAAQRVEHYEIAGYGSVRTYARLLGDEDAASLLEETLKEEKETDQKLSSLAQQINLQAGNSENEDEEVRPSRARSSNGARRGKPARVKSRASR